MRVLAVAPYVPFDGVPHAGGEYLLRHLQAIARDHELTLLVPGSPEAIQHAERTPAWLDLVLGPMDLKGRSIQRRLRDAAYRRIMASPPAPTAESLRAVLDAGLIELAHDADVVELHWPEYARFASTLRRRGIDTPISVLEYDVDLYAIARRVRRYSRGYRRVLGLLSSPLSRRIERRGLADADLVLLFKPEDEATLRRAGVATSVRVIDPWLDEPQEPAPDRQPRSLVFAGAMWRDENDEGAKWFLDHVWGPVRSVVPDAQFTIAGAGPTDELIARAATSEGVVVTGEVPDLLPYYQRGTLFVAPLFVGGGLKFKIPQAMLCGTPVVATRCAAQGIVDVAPPDVFWAIADDAETMIEAIVEACHQPDRAAAVAETAEAWCRARFSFRASIAAVLADYEAVRERRGSGTLNEP